MPKVIFREKAELENAAGVVVESYDAGSVHDLPMDKCHRWIKRNKAEWYKSGEPAKEPDLAPLQKPEAGTGPSLNSGEAKPPSASHPDQALNEAKSKDAGDSGPSPSTGESGPKAAPNSTAPSRTSYTPPMRHGGGDHKTRRGSRG